MGMVTEAECSQYGLSLYLLDRMDEEYLSLHH